MTEDSILNRYADELTKVNYITNPAIARENEIKTVRIILSGKQSGFSDDSIRERVREMYV